MNFHKEDTFVIGGSFKIKKQPYQNEKPPSFSIESPVTDLLRKPPLDF